MKMKCSDLPDLDVLLAIARKRGLVSECFPEVPINVLTAKLRKLERRGLIEYGVSLNSSFLAAKGRALLIEAGFTEEAKPARLKAEDLLLISGGWFELMTDIEARISVRGRR